MSPNTKQADIGPYVAGLLTPVVLPAVMAVMVVPPLLAKTYVLTCLWAWYAQPLGAPPLRAALAFGICLMFTLLSAKPMQKPNKDRDYPAWGLVLSGTVGPFVILFLGWLGTFFI